MNYKIPLAKPSIKEEDINKVAEVLKSGRLSLGPKLKEFEEKFASFIGTKYAIAVSSGTCALHLCVKALGLKKGDEVITTPFSFIASSNCLLYEDVKPVFVDINKETFNIDETKIEKAITEKTKAILMVHIFGRPCNIDKIGDIAKKHNLCIIEDSAEALGSKFNGKYVGAFGDASIFAFYANKQITTGEGGIILTDNKEVADLCRSLRNQGRGSNMQWLEHDKLGFNYRMSEINAALGVSQLNRIEEIIAKRKIIFKTYQDKLKNIPEIILPAIEPLKDTNWFVYTVLVKNLSRNIIIEKLAEKGIECKAYFDRPIHLQPFYKEKFGCKEGDFPLAESVCKKTLTLPFYTDMLISDVNFVCDTLKEILKSMENDKFEQTKHE